MRKLVVNMVLLGIVLLVPVLSSALVLNVELTPAETTIRMNETAEFDLRISHDGSETITIDMYSLDILWDLQTDDILAVPPSGLETTIRIRPLRSRDPGFYGVPITFSAGKYNTKMSTTALVGLRPIVDVLAQYTPSIRTKMSIPQQVDPQQSFTIVVDVENLNPRKITDMTAYIRSSLLNEDRPVTLDSFEKKQFVFDVSIDPDTTPQTDTVYVTFVTEHEGRTLHFEVRPASYQVIEYGEIAEEVEQTKGFLTLRQESHLTNTGNAQRTSTYRVETGWFQDFFTTTDPEVEEEDGFYTWQVTLEPNESRTLIVKRNYWSLFVFFVVVVLVILAYYVFRAPIVLRKEVRKLGSHELRVSVFAKNRGAKALYAVGLIESVPQIFSVMDNKFGPGKVVPSHIAKLMSKKTNEHKGTRLRWDLGKMDSGDELVVQYTLRTRVAMVGTVTLDPVTCYYQHGDRQSQVKSKPASGQVGNL